MATEDTSKVPDHASPTDMQQLAANVVFAEALHRADTVIAPLNTEGDKVPIFWVHSVTGQGTDPIPLARNLGPDQPFYSIRAPSIKRDMALAASVEDMARFYVAEIDRFQPAGPLIIGGWSAGVVVALEMAQQLQIAGREVRHLVAVDFAPLNSRIRINPVAAFARRATNWLYTESKAQRSYRQLGRRIWQQMLESTRQALRTHPLDDLVSSRGYSEAESAFVRTLHDKVDAYVPAPYAGSVLFYCAVDGDGGAAMNNRNMRANHMIRVWQSIAGRVTVSKIDADHISLIKGPAVADLARPMQADLGRAEP
jgi:thioesterase domain-containing protein